MACTTFSVFVVRDTFLSEFLLLENLSLCKFGRGHCKSVSLDKSVKVEVQCVRIAITNPPQESLNTVDVDNLLAALDSENPCGLDLEYDPLFIEMAEAAQGKPEQQFGDTVIPAEDPDWKQVRKKAISVLERTKDLRAVVYLANASLATTGLVDFRDCLLLIKGYVELFWNNFHPQLDPDDDDDPTMRINALIALCDQGSTLKLLNETPIVSAPIAGRFSRKDYLISTGDLTPPPEMETIPDAALVDAAFNEAPTDELKTTFLAVSQSIAIVEEVENRITESVDVTRTASLDSLKVELRQIEAILDSRLSARGVSVEETESLPDEEGDGGDEESGDESKASEIAQPKGLSGEILDRQDVIRALDLICRYYDRFEPSSPIPLLINRAKRLASMSFVDILRNLAPEAVENAQLLAGIDQSPPNGDETQ